MPEDKNKVAQSTEAPPAAKMDRAVVARGRTVVGHDPNDLQIVGLTPDGEKIMRPALVHYQPGQEILLPVLEIRELRKLGYLTDPEAVAPPMAEGPTFAQKA